MSIIKFKCETCAFSTNIGQIYKSHLQSKRHKEQIDSDEFIYDCEKCKV